MARYELVERIGMGGMAEIYRGKATAAGGFEKPVAIKKILPHLSQDKRFVELLITEAKTLSSLRHRNIVQIYDVGLGDDGQYFLVMEYVDGADLGALYEFAEKRGRRLPLAVSLHVCGEVCEALDHAHRARGPSGQSLGLVHRDVSPSNVLLSRSGEVKLTDFGIAKRTEEVTGHGGVRGKFAYISPEQAHNTHVDGRSDVYSVGIVLYELLTGTRLFSDLPDFDALRAVREGRTRHPRDVDPSIDPELDRIVMTALAHRADDRYPNAAVFGAQLRSYRYSAVSAAADPAVELSRLIDELGGREPAGVVSRKPPTFVRISTVAGFSGGFELSEETTGDGFTGEMTQDRALDDHEETHAVRIGAVAPRELARFDSETLEEGDTRVAADPGALRDPRRRSDGALDRPRPRDRDPDRDRGYARDPRDRDRDADLDRAHARDRDADLDRAHARDADLERGYARARDADLDHAHAHARDADLERGYARARDADLDGARDADRDRARGAGLDRAHARDADLDRARDRGGGRNGGAAGNGGRVRDRDSSSGLEVDHARSSEFDLSDAETSVVDYRRPRGLFDRASRASAGDGAVRLPGVSQTATPSDGHPTLDRSLDAGGDPGVSSVISSAPRTSGSSRPAAAAAAAASASPASVGGAAGMGPPGRFTSSDERAPTTRFAVRRWLRTPWSSDANRVLPPAPGGPDGPGVSGPGVSGPGVSGPGVSGPGVSGPGSAGLGPGNGAALASGVATGNGLAAGGGLATGAAALAASTSGRVAYRRRLVLIASGAVVVVAILTLVFAGTLLGGGDSAAAEIPDAAPPPDAAVTMTMPPEPVPPRSRKKRKKPPAKKKTSKPAKNARSTRSGGKTSKTDKPRPDDKADKTDKSSKSDDKTARDRNDKR